MGWSEGLEKMLFESQRQQENLKTPMVNFICQLDWALGHPNICLDIILGVPVRIFLDEINT